MPGNVDSEFMLFWVGGEQQGTAFLGHKVIRYWLKLKGIQKESRGEDRVEKRATGFGHWLFPD
ncbi:hypothetical protein SLEP1_g33906 [Rubroshorea leprosula]|uniref:Uncharacterized protein n=1 Tax=Rubroshorea leprosula TaxID=152421 RepID=A0AAV5KI76_9ROSI|nr:hypothetical protein SLEP1_g33906 [Rubroshorea leprosula]